MTSRIPRIYIWNCNQLNPLIITQASLDIVYVNITLNY